MANKFSHLAIAALLIALLVLLSDPFMLWMPAPAQMAALVAAAALAALWAGFVTYERAHDEREAAHKLYAGRVAYLFGIGVLTVALLVQGFAHDIDPWISIALAAMVVSKLLARFYSERRR